MDKWMDLQTLLEEVIKAYDYPPSPWYQRYKKGYEDGGINILKWILNLMYAYENKEREE